MNNEVANNEVVEQYIAQFTPSEKIVYEIARKQLESSFCIEKSIGFLEYVKTVKNLSTVKNFSTVKNLSSKENQ
jgi:hypothetical protein